MIFESIYNDVISSFGSLWTFKERDKSLEIITPFATTSQKFVSIFLSHREGEYIISDGGWIDEGVYDNSFNRKIECFNKIVFHYQSSFKIKEVKSPNGVIYFYKKTTNQISVPSLIFDMANFISALVSTSEVQFSDKEDEIETSFSRSAKDYLSGFVKSGDIYFNEYLDRKKEVKVNAIIRKPNDKLVLLNFITGSNYYYFRSNISKTNIIFELAAKAQENIFIENKIALIDNTATGYIPDRVSIWLQHLLSNTNSKKIEWTAKEELQDI